MLDEEQAAMMAEECILVDRHDRPTGSASKVGDRCLDFLVIVCVCMDTCLCWCSYWNH